MKLSLAMSWIDDMKFKAPSGPVSHDFRNMSHLVRRGLIFYITDLALSIALRNLGLHFKSIYLHPTETGDPRSRM